MIKAMLCIGLGGGVGSMLRYGLSVWVQRQLEGDFPFGTFFVNVSGSFLIGWLMGCFEAAPVAGDMPRLLLAVGFCGGFTTFSAFSLEVVRLLQSNQTMAALLYVVGSLLLCFVATSAGLWLSAQP